MKGKDKKILIYPLSVLILTVALLFYSCVNEIVFDTPEEGGHLIIDGTITNGDRPHTITVARTSPSGGIIIPVTSAEAWIEDNEGNREQLVENYIPETDSNSPTARVPIIGYTLVGNIVKGTPGNSYTLEVLLEDGRSYKSMPETMPTVQAIDSIRFNVGTEQELSPDGVIQELIKAQVFLGSTIPEGPVYLKWDLEHLYARVVHRLPLEPQFCYVNDYFNAQEFVLFDGTDTPSLQMEELLLGSKTINNDFFYLSFMNVVQSSMSKTSFAYWNQVQQVVANVGTIFDVPGATPVGNISDTENPDEEVLGFFGAELRDTVNILLSRQDFNPRLVTDPCALGANFNRNRAQCTDCQTLPNSTEIKPAYWPN